MSTTAIAFAAPDDAEELARAEMYGVLSRLYMAAPDEMLLRQFAVAVTEAPVEGAFLQQPWEALVAALRQATPAEVADEYDALFQGVGKPEVFLYGSYYLAGFCCAGARPELSSGRPAAVRSCSWPAPRRAASSWS